jgi:hypothetical protein
LWIEGWNMSSGTVALALHHDLPFIPPHYYFIAFTSRP